MELLHYREHGEGQPVVLLHGLFGSLDNLSAVGRELARSFKVIQLDLPDHGQSYRSKQFSYQGYADGVIRTIDHLGIDKFILLGHSMGGKVAMQISLTHPQRTSRLVIADIAPVAYPDHHSQIFAALNSVNLANLASRSDADDIMAAHIDNPGVRQFLLKSLYQHDEQWSWRFNLELLYRDYARIRAAIDSNSPYQGPCLFIKGGMSDYIQASHRQAISQLFPAATAHLMPQCGHWLHAEKPQQFSRIVQKFILE